jgi:hypothetical protein
MMMRTLFLLLALLASTAARAQMQMPNPATVDSFRAVIVDGFNYNEKIYIGDTLAFVQMGLYSFVNYDNTSTFYDVLLCYEPRFNREAEPPSNFVTVQQQRMIRDIRWVFLFFLDQYVLRAGSNQNKVNKQSRIALLDIKKDDFVDLYGEKGFDNVIPIYQALLVAMHKKPFAEDVVKNRKVSLLEFVGYRWQVF